MESQLFLLKTAVTVVLTLGFAVEVQGYTASVECSSYRFLNESNRAQTYKTPNDYFLCDISLLGWYRFGGEAGTQMADSCVPVKHCGTYRSGWLNGRHPSVADGAVERQVCFTGSSDCTCYVTVSITVRNCGTFYVYYLKKPSRCYLRYCGNGIKPTQGTTPSRSTSVVLSSVSSSKFPQYAPAQQWSPTTTTGRVKSPTTARAVNNFGIVEPFPENVFPVEFTSVQVTCVAFDSSGLKTPERIQFVRKSRYGLSTDIATNDNVYFTNRTEDVNYEDGKKTSKLFTTLHIRKVTLEDDSQYGPLGRYECHAYAVGEPTVRKHGFGVNVIKRSEIPVVSVSKFGVLQHNDQVTLLCNVTEAQRSKTTLKRISWYKDGFRLQTVCCTVPNIPEDTLGPLLVKDGGNYSCVVEVMLRNIKEYNVSDYTVVRFGPVCPEERLEGVTWSITSRRGTDVKPCPNGAKGTALRKCSAEGIWNKANFTGCSSPEFIKLMGAILNGFGSELNAQQVLSQLANASQPTKDDFIRPPEIYKKDLIIAVDILVKLAEYNVNTANVSSTEDVENYAQVASNLLDLKNKKTWNELDKVGQGRSQILVKALDDYGLGVAATFNEPTKTKVVLKKNLKMRIDRVGESSPLKEKGLKVAYNESSIRLPPQAFSSTQDARVVTLIYLTLHEVLSLPKANKDDSGQPFSPSTTIVSSTVSPRPQDVSSQPVKVALRRNKKISSTPDMSLEWTCVFWRPVESAMWKTSGCRLVHSESNATITTCECNHLTVFAALMDPYGSQSNKPLEIISIVGCSVSLVAVVITIAMFLIFWRELKSPGVKVLLNLCAAIAVSCALVIFEGSARNKVGCPTVAALLHYFLLALFSWMLCEGTLHYLALVKVVGGDAEDKIKYFCIFGWGFPAIIVAISLAITKTNGYGNSFCWLDVKSGLIWAFIGPALFVILINIVVYVQVIRSMMGSSLTRNKTQIEKVKAGVKASVVLFPLLGITWLFGLLSFSSETIAFKYLFAILNSLQGLMIFVFKFALNKQVQDAIKRRLRKKRTTNPKVKQSDGSPFIQATKGQSGSAEYDYEHEPVTTEPRKDKLVLKTLLKQEEGTGVNDETHPKGNLLSHSDE